MAIFSVVSAGVDEDIIDFRASSTDVQLGSTDIQLGSLQIDLNNL